jgi:hypothetical protein
MGAAYGEGCEMRATLSGSEIESSANTRLMLQEKYTVFILNI